MSCLSQSRITIFFHSASRGWPGFQVISGVLMVVALVALYRALPPGFIRFAKPGES